ncbi:MAG: hypothetical protein AAGA95_16095, partial [Pseudomonadota bacterium]
WRATEMKVYPAWRNLALNTTHRPLSQKRVDQVPGRGALGRTNARENGRKKTPSTIATDSASAV